MALVKLKAKPKRNYRKEYDNYHGKPDQIKRRDSRNAARNLLKKKDKNLQCRIPK